MRYLLILSPLLVVGVYSDDNCKSLRAEFQACTEQAFATYTAAYGGEDGRDSFNARKTCNYMTDVLEVCPEKLRKDGCTSPEGVEWMDRQMHSILKTVKSSVAEWDSCKCPPIKAHLDRMKAKAGAKVAEECPSLVQEQKLPEEDSFMEIQHSYEPSLQPVREVNYVDFGYIGSVILATGMLLVQPLLVAFS